MIDRRRIQRHDLGSLGVGLELAGCQTTDYSRRIVLLEALRTAKPLAALQAY